MFLNLIQIINDIFINNMGPTLFNAYKNTFDNICLFIPSQKEVAQLTCECERHIGTQSGGMDQVYLYNITHKVTNFLSN